MAPNPPSKPALKPEFNWVVVLMLPKWVAPNPLTELTPKSKFDWEVDCKPAGMPKFCCPPPTPNSRMSKGDKWIPPPMLSPMAELSILPGDAVIVLAFMVGVAVTMAVIGIPPGDNGIVLAFVATAAAVVAFIRGEVGVCAIVGMARRELGLINCVNTKGEFHW